MEGVQISFRDCVSVAKLRPLPSGSEREITVAGEGTVGHMTVHRGMLPDDGT